MNRKKNAGLILSLGVMAVIGVCLIKYTISAKDDKNIKVIEYIPPTINGENGYQIDKYENIENNQWLDENHLLCLTKKGDFKNPDSTISIRYCSIYNLNTNESKDFNNVDMDEFLGVSPDKKYVLYAEPRVIPKIESDEWKKADESGDLLHKKVKLLNLFTGEITDLNTEKINCSAEFRWVGNNKILVNYNTHWAIIDTNGKVYIDGNYSREEHENPNIAGTDDIKDLGDSVEGKFYYTQDIMGKKFRIIATKLCYMDVKTKEIKTLCSNENFHEKASKKGNTIVIGRTNPNGGKVDGVYVNATSSEDIMDASGKVVRSIDVPKGRSQSNYILSPDGRKAAYLEGDDPIYSKNADKYEQNLEVIDIKTGDVREIVKESSLKDEKEEVKYSADKLPFPDGNREVKAPINKEIYNICWSSTGKELSFTYGNSFFDDIQRNTYIVSFDK